MSLSSMRMMVLTGAALIVLLLAGGAGVAEAQPGARKFYKEKTYRSQRSFRKGLRKPFREIDSGKLVFRSKRGRALKRIDLRGKLDGFTRHPVPTRNGAVVKKSTSGYEWAATGFVFYSKDGEKTGEVSSLAGEHGISPGGDLVVVAHQDKIGIPSFAAGMFSFFDASGAKMAEHGVFGFGGEVTYAFSTTGRYGAILMNAYPKSPKTSGGIGIFSRNGKILSTHVAEKWQPLSLDAEDAPGGLHRPLARVDETNRLVIAQGIERGNFDAHLYCVDFNGKFQWQWSRPTQRGFAATMGIRPRHGDIFLLEMGFDKTTVYSIALKSGQVLQKKTFPFATKKAVRFSRISSSVNVATGEVLVTISNAIDSSGAQKNIVLLINGNLDVAWREEGPNTESLEANFDDSGRVVLRRGTKFYVGQVK